ncbi:MAG: cytochrome c3 family protein [Planctomycetota bacterium]
MVPDIPTSWQTKARFDHRPHVSMRCEQCHDMSTNTVASELRLPGIATCRECHSASMAKSSCETCHPYHR